VASLNSKNILIKTIFWNTTEIDLWVQEWGIEAKIALQAPSSANKEWAWKLSRLDTPLWILIKNDLRTVYFLDKVTQEQIWLTSHLWVDLIWKLNKFSWNNQSLNWDGQISFLEESKVKLLEPKKVSFENTEDFVSSSQVSKLQFKKLKKQNSSAKKDLVQVDLKLVDYFKENEKNETNLKTVLSSRKFNIEN
jgi:hypothetical protein